jgi:DNA-binding transcriptional LysR family regulator
VELRDIEIFLTLAEELHFGRTAQRLHVSSARVSQSIALQERRIGAALFKRSSRAVALTPIGAQLRDDLAVGYHTIRTGLERATEAARGVSGTVRLGVMGAVGHELRAVIEAFQTRHPGCDVALREVHFGDPFTALRSGELDLVVVWRPVREPDLVEGPVVLIEGIHLAVWQGHELAGRESVSMEDFGDRVFADAGPRAPRYWTEALLPTRTPAGRPILRGPAVTTFQELLAMIANRQGLAVPHDHSVHYYTHPGVVLVPVRDAAPTEWAMVHRKDDVHPRVQGLLDVAAEFEQQLRTRR